MNTITSARIKGMSPQLLVSDIDKAIGFYTDTLGFQLQFRHEDFYAGIVKDGFTVHLKTGAPAEDERKRKQQNEDLDIVFSVVGVDELYAGYESKGVKMLTPVCDRPYGREFYVVDPDGYVLAFLEEE